MLRHPDPIVGHFLIAGSGDAVADRKVSDPGPRFWHRHIERYAHPFLEVGGRRLFYRGPFGERAVDEPTGNLSYRGYTLARQQTPWLVDDFEPAFIELVGHVDEVIFHTGSLHFSFTKMKGSTRRAFISNALECVAPILRLAEAGLPVAISNDFSNVGGTDDLPWWHWIEMLNQLGLPQYLEGAGNPAVPRQLTYPFTVYDSSYRANPPDLSLYRSYGQLAMDQASVPAAQSWRTSPTWTRAWIEGALAAGFSSVVLPPEHLIGAGLRADQYRRPTSMEASR